MSPEQQLDFNLNWMLRPVPFEPSQKSCDPVRSQATAIGNMMAQAVLLYPDQVRQGEYGLEVFKNLPNGTLKLNTNSVKASSDHAKIDNLELEFIPRTTDGRHTEEIYRAYRSYNRDGVSIFAESHRSGAIYGVPQLVEQAFQPLFKIGSRQTLVQRIAEERASRDIEAPPYQPMAAGYSIKMEREAIAAILLSKHELQLHGAQPLVTQMGMGVALAVATVLLGQKSKTASTGFNMLHGAASEWRLDVPEKNGQLVVSASTPRGWYSAPEKDLITLEFEACFTKQPRQTDFLFMLERVYDPAQEGVVLASRYMPPQYEARKLPAILYNQLAQSGLQKQLRQEVKAIRCASAGLK